MEVDVWKILITIGMCLRWVIAQRPHVHGATWHLCVVHDLIIEMLSPSGQGRKIMVAGVMTGVTIREIRKGKTF